MKTRILAAVAAVLGFSAFAAVEKVATVQIADKATLVQTATRAGELVGYPMLGMMATMGLADNPVNAELGEFREGTSALVAIYADTENLTPENLENILSTGGLAIVYAPVTGKQDFLAAKEGRTETDGAIASDGAYVVYSEDGSWAAVGTTADFAKAALSDVAAAQAPMDGDFIRVAFTGPFMKICAELCRQTSDEFAKQGISVKTMPSTIEALEMVAGGFVGLRIGDAGLDVRGSLTPAEGSPLSKICLKPLACPLAFAPSDSVGAASAAEGSGCDFEKVMAFYNGMAAALKEMGVNVDWYKCVSDGSVFKVSCDVAAAVQYFTGEEAQSLGEKINVEELQAKILALYSDDMNRIAPDSKPFAASFSIPGVDSKVPMAELYAKILPEAATCNPAVVGIYRYYSAIKALAPQFLGFAPESSQSVLKAGIASLPSDDDAAIVYAVYRDGADLRFMTRASAAEIRGFAAVFNAAVGYAAMAGMEYDGGCDSGCDYDDSDDED